MSVITFIDYYSTNKVETFNITDNYTSTIIMSESPLVSVNKVEERTDTKVVILEADQEITF